MTSVLCPPAPGYVIGTRNTPRGNLWSVKPVQELFIVTWAGGPFELNRKNKLHPHLSPTRQQVGSQTVFTKKKAAQALARELNKAFETKEFRVTRLA